jgi:hypothetical protein
MDNLGGDVCGAVCGRDSTDLAEQLEHRQIRGRTAVGQAMAFAVDHRLAVETVGEFGEQPRLPHAGLSGNTDDLTLPTDRLRQPRMEQGHLVFPPDQATRRPSATPGHPRPALRETVHRVRRHGRR